MENLKKELFFKLATKNWLRLHYANEKFDLFFDKEQQKIKFHLADKDDHNIYLSGLVLHSRETVKFEYNEQESAWFENTHELKHIKNENITDLLENLFCSMLIQGDSK